MPTRTADTQGHPAKLALMGLFLGAFLSFVGSTSASRRHVRRLDLPWSDWLLLIGATFHRHRRNS